jgi:AraC-like DNA-binding protein
LERIEAYFAGHAFDPHRHDTYAIGLTLDGVQDFDYRGAAKRSTPGRVIVLHPDETHDGRAGNAAGFRYRMLYIAPALIQRALDAKPRPLPFVREAVTSDPRLVAAVGQALADIDAPLEELQVDHLVLDLADALAAVDPRPAARPLSAVHLRAVERAREVLDAGIGRTVRSRELEAATGMSRYALARHFRARLGTSPYRYLVMRRLDRARALIQRGDSLAEAAGASGFADQSHMTRHFHGAYGISPGRWAAMVAAPPR